MPRRNAIRQYLLARDLEAVENMASGGVNIFRTLSSMLYADDLLLRWRAIEGIGRASKVIARADMEKVRRQVRRILWLMNDESGGICWNGPETIGEIIVNVPALIDEYSGILVSFLNQEPFETGARQAIARIAGLKAEIFNDSSGILIQSLDSADPSIRGSSVKALTAIGDSSAFEKISSMNKDSAILDDYNFSTGQLEKIPVSYLADGYLKAMKSRAGQIGPAGGV
jgi:hypothetical protein